MRGKTVKKVGLSHKMKMEPKEYMRGFPYTFRDIYLITAKNGWLYMEEGEEKAARMVKSAIAQGRHMGRIDNPSRGIYIFK